MGEALALPLALERLGIEGIELRELAEHRCPGELGQGAGVVGVEGAVEYEAQQGDVAMA